MKPGHSDDGDCSVENCDKVSDPGSHWNYAYSLNPKYIQVLSAVFADLGMDDIEESSLISAIQEFDGDATRIFADGLYRRVGDLAPEYASDSSTFAGVDPGYYLIAETGTAGPGDSTSLVMLDTAGLDEVHVTSKESAPTLEKKIFDAVPGYWDEIKKTDGGFTASSADYRLPHESEPFYISGGYVWYAVTVTLPDMDVLKSYDTYKMVVYDEVAEGLRFDTGSESIYTAIDGHEYVYSNGDVVTHRYYACESVVENDVDRGIKFTFDDIKSISDIAKELSGISPMYGGFGHTYHGANELRIFYRCEITDYAVPGYAGNPNTAWLSFSNNPYDEASMGETPKDKTSAFVFGLQVNKVNEYGRLLDGAEFALQKWQLAYDYDEEGYLIDVGDWYDTPAVMENIDPGVFEIRNLSPGKYKLIETKAPDGCERIDDIFFEIVAESEVLSDDPKLTKLDIVDENGESMMRGEDAMFSLDPEAGMFVTNVVNYAGVKLPSTGGSGVYGIYMTGVVMALAGMGVVMVYGMNRKKKEAR